MTDGDEIDMDTKTMFKVFDEPCRDVCFVGITTKLRERQTPMLAAWRFVPRRLASVLEVVMYETKQVLREG